MDRSSNGNKGKEEIEGGGRCGKRKNERRLRIRGSMEK